MKIIENKVKCLICNTIIESKTNHDFATCPCGNVFVDGGKEYLRRGAVHMDKYQELSITEGNDENA